MGEKHGTNVSYRPAIIFLVGLLILWMGTWLSQKSYGSESLYTLIITLVFVLWGFGGFFMAKEKTFPGFGKFLGTNP